ncbi:K(+)/H(+) antiporter 1 [Ceratobasidium theobromae]|uniref:K(+)/H(+) antiporter 1 n=1 Tax=Ceratobasidium theobromae TaxID=1582974 RepID=A0A5N5QW91_9AGAM|nr:K(+)/H(+) antiporter 1 [Ceratobasidium theobromae]
MSRMSSDWTRVSISRLVGRAAEQQGGLLTGSDPSAYNPKDPIRLFIIQLGVIMLMTQLLSLFLGRIRQPKVIAEVIGGIILGPTAMGRIPGFTEHVFPEPSRPFLALVANIGLVLFLFLVGLEIDTAVIRRNAKTSMIISAGGMILPFGLGAAVAIPVYNKFIDPEAASFGHFLLFVGVAFSITAFPVLCRILVALKLLDTTVGIVVLSAGVGNDIVGWTLLALTVALVNASSGLTALYVLLCAVGWTLLIVYPIKRGMKWLARWTGSIESGPSPLFMTATILLVFGSAFFTDIIGVHAIFGGFLAGLAIPHEGGLAIALTEKLEDMVSIIFLPLYFTLSGLSTNLGLLNNGMLSSDSQYPVIDIPKGITWGYTILICVAAYIGKFCGGTLAARLSGFTIRESATIGTLMSCKGLVELIVLNVGLSAGILSTRVFSMFVLEALTLTFATTPVTLWLYPLKYRVRVTAVGGNFGHASDEDHPPRPSNTTDDDMVGLSGRRKFLFVLDKFESLPGAMMLSRLLQATPSSTEALAPPSPETEEPKIEIAGSPGSRSAPSLPANEPAPVPRRGVTVDALRLLELTERTSAVMRSSEVDQILMRDPLLTVFRTFAELEDVPVAGSLSIVAHENFAASVTEHSTKNGDEMVVVGWSPTYPSHGHTTAPSPAITPAQNVHNPFDSLFKTGTGGMENVSSGIHSHFLRQVFAQSPVDVALFVDRGRVGGQSFGGSGGAQHLFLPFFGGPDDRLALSFVVQLCKHPLVSATIVRMHKAEAMDDLEPLTAPEEAHIVDKGTTARGESTGKAREAVYDDEQAEAVAAALKTNNVTVHSASGFPDTIYDQANTEMQLASNTLDDIMWAKCTTTAEPAPSASVSEALARIAFKTHSSASPLRSIVSQAQALGAKRRLISIAGRGKRLAAESHREEIMQIVEGLGLDSVERGVAAEIRKTVGDVGAALMLSAVQGPMVVLQAAYSSSD